MKTFIMIAVLSVSVSAFAEEEQARQPARATLNVDDALNAALEEQKRTYQQDDERAVSRAMPEETPKIFIQIGDES